MVDMGHLNSQYSGTNAFSRDANNSHVRSSRGALACMINSEIGAVLAVMRRNVRWGVRYVSDEDQLDHPLILSLKELRKQIFSWKNQWHNINPTLYLQPFLDVIQSDETGAPITGVALSSIYKVLTLDILDLNTVNVEVAMHKIIDAVTSCRFEVTDPGSEEVVLMKILQVLLACMKGKVSVKLSNQHVCNIINTCFRVVHQASSKGELLQRIARHTMHELVRCIFSCLPYIKKELTNGSSSYHSEEADTPNTGCTISGSKENTSIALAGMLSIERGDANKNLEIDNGFQAAQNDEKLMIEPFGVPCMVEILYFLCSLLNAIEHTDIGSRLSPIAYDEDVPLFALGLINSAIELGGPSFSRHPKLLSLIQDELFRNLMKFGLSMSPLILSMISSIVLNLYQHLRTELKVQLEAFFSFVLLQIAESKHGSFYQRQEVAMEALVDLCRQETFMAEMFANFDCDITSSNVFEDVASLLSKSAFPVNEPLSAMHTLALNGLLSMIHGISERIGQESYIREELSTGAEYMPFWMLTCESFDDPNKWAPFVRKMKNIKRRLAIGADHFNRDPKKGLEFAQGAHLLPDELTPQSVAYFFRYTAGIDKNLIGDYLGNHDEFCVKVLHEFARTFDFEGMNLDIGLRLFLGTFRLPGESQKIQRVLEAFAGRYYEQSPHIFNDKDAALLLSYSLILLNTDQHNLQVKKKMTKEDFIRNNRHINGGNDLPREYLSELYQSICENEIQMIPDQSANYPGITSSRWINVMHKSRSTTPFIFCNSKPILDYDMFGILSGPTIAALSVVFDQAEQDDVLETCVNGFLAIAKISASYNSGQLLDDLVVSLCRFANFETQLSIDDAILSFGEDIKARMATSTIFIIANTYGDYIRSSWKNILDCVLSFHKLGVLPAHLVTDATDGLELLSDTAEHARLTNSFSKSQITSNATPRKSSGLIGRFSQLLSFEMEEQHLQPTEEQLAAQNQTRETIQSWHIDSIFMESKFLQADSLLQLVQALISAATRFRKGGTFLEDENTAVFCLELLIAIALNNRDRIMLIWEAVFAHISNIVQSTVMPCNLVEKAVFGLLQICQRLLPYKENLTDELLKSLQLILKLDARVADAYCEPITIEVSRLVKANATHIRSHMGWRTVTSLLSITARHPEASEVGFETLVFIMSDGTHLFPSNYVLCIDAARQFAESRLVEIDRSLTAIDLMGNSVTCLICWSSKARSSISDDEAKKVSQDIGEMWLRLVQALKKMCLDQREEIRNHSILMLQRSLTSVDPFQLPTPNILWFQCFDLAIFPLLDELLEMSQSKSLKMEGTLVLSMKLMSKSFLQVLHALSQQPNFCKLWLGVLQEMEKYMKVKLRGRRSEKIHELVPGLLKNTLLVMKTTGILMKSNDIGADSFWQLTWLHVKNICPTLEVEVFPDGESENLFDKHVETLVSDGTTV